jgi:hypothetical protein
VVASARKLTSSLLGDALDAVGLGVFANRLAAVL